jgi:plastocyanin
VKDGALHGWGRDRRDIRLVFASNLVDTRDGTLIALIFMIYIGMKGSVMKLLVPGSEYRVPRLPTLLTAAANCRCLLPTTTTVQHLPTPVDVSSGKHVITLHANSKPNKTPTPGQGATRMKHTYTLLAAMAIAGAASAQTTYDLTNGGTTFVPDVINMQVGDSIHLAISAPHTCTEVSQATWIANGNTSNGGFNYPSGVHTFALNTAGTYYYVCIPHAGMSMKGVFNVESGVGVPEQEANAVLQLSPNPANTSVHIAGVASGQRIQVREVTGRVVLETILGEDGMVDISSLHTGNYSIVVRDEQGNLTAAERMTIAR